MSTATSGRIGRFSAAAMIAVTASFAAPPAAVSAASPPTASGHAQVVAQQIVDVSARPHHWSVDSSAVESDAVAVQTVGGAGFVVATRGTLLAVDGAGVPIARLAAGEAVPFGATGELSLAASGTEPGAYVTIQVVAGEPSGLPTDVGGPFTPDAGWYDLDLVRDVLAVGESGGIVYTGAEPTLLLMTSGSLTVAADDSVVLIEGDVLLIGGDVQLTNIGDVPAVYVAAVFGPAVYFASLPVDVTASTTTAPASTTTAPATTTTAADAEPAACDGYRDNVQYPIRRCDAGEAVRLIQIALVESGYSVDVDGFFGAQTEQAVRAFQADSGLDVDGLVGPRTWAGLLALLPLTSLPGNDADVDTNGVIDPYELGQNPPQPVVSVSFSPHHPAPGDAIEVSGSGCPPGGQVDVGTGHADETDGSEVSATTTSADADGSFAVTTTVSELVAPGTEFVLWVDCGDRQATITILAAGEPPSPPDSDGTDSARVTDPFVGPWHGVDPFDNSSVQVTFSGSGAERTVEYFDDDGTVVCDTGGFVTASGTGVVGDNQLAVDELVLECADGTPPSSFAAVFYYDPDTNTLSDDLDCTTTECIVYHRPDISVPPGEPPSLHAGHGAERGPRTGTELPAVAQLRGGVDRHPAHSECRPARRVSAGRRFRAPTRDAEMDCGAFVARDGGSGLRAGDRHRCAGAQAALCGPYVTVETEIVGKHPMRIQTPRGHCRVYERSHRPSSTAHVAVDP